MGEDVHMGGSNGGRGRTTAAASAATPRTRVFRALAGVLAYVYGGSNAGGTLGVPDVCLRWFQRTWETRTPGAPPAPLQTYYAPPSTVMETYPAVPLAANADVCLPRVPRLVSGRTFQSIHASKQIISL
ncbi:hypothetical protein M422DRAFT_272902 [Sphaerobolus stellatus SS14]|uniref:Uncharacterized protein n=1 Tax=Sphaerobolus stellatus (strain SS14) TaxID=990650 RepID=A0A0C9ULF5_SPHS4|nr:hypothetical protein M422DRAFT_272902 [Sphaerobolus stellatus SS14]